MKYNTKKHKRARSSSNSSVFSISDDDSPKPPKVRKHSKERHSIKRHHHKHNRDRNLESLSEDEVNHHKHHRDRNLELLSDDEINTKYRGGHDKSNKHRSREVVVKEEPFSGDERERKYKNRHDKYSRAVNEKRNDRGKRDDSRRKPEQSDSRNKKNRVPVKEEIQSEVEPEWGKKEIKKEKEPQKNNAKPDFGLSGKLTEDANTFNGVVIKYSEPPEAKKPKRRWRLYPFKGETSLPVLHIHRQSAYLMGRDRKVADIPIDHPSCSKQHAALQYRLTPFFRKDGSRGRQTRLYLIDLESANGTFLNNKKIEPKKYYGLKERDVIKFGFSSREYVVLHEHSKDSENDDDVQNDN